MDLLFDIVEFAMDYGTSNSNTLEYSCCYLQMSNQMCKFATKKPIAIFFHEENRLYKYGLATVFLWLKAGMV